MILHLINDHQIVERSLSVFEDVFPGKNKVIAFTNRPGEIKFLKNREIVTKDNVKKFKDNYNFEGIKVVLVHYLSFEKIEFLRSVPSDIPVVWWVYGADLYNQFIDTLYRPIYYIPVHKFQKWVVFRYKPILDLYSIIRGHFISKKYLKELFDFSIQRIDYLYGNRADMELLSEITKKEFKCFHSLMPLVDRNLKSLKESGFSTGKDILVGNSGSCSNNHFYSLKYLEKLNIGSKKIILQMAYGSPSKYYSQTVIKKFKKTFGDNINPILQYMPLDEYNKTFLNIGTIILSNWRQESVGTIHLAFYLGIKVILSNKSPMFHQLKNDGYIIFETEKLSQELLDYEMTTEEKNHNKDLFINKSKPDKCRENMIKAFSPFLDK